MWTPTSDRAVDEFHPEARIFFSQPLNEELVSKLKDTIESLSQQHIDDRILREVDIQHVQDHARTLADMKECLAAAEETIRFDEFMSLIDML